MFDLEVSLIGTPAELDAAARALSRIGRIVDRRTRTPLAGSDAVRYRIYARIRVPVVAKSATPARPDATNLAA